MAALAAETTKDSEEDLDGKRVALHGLKGAADLNYREGVVRGAIDSATGRYTVELEAVRETNAPARTVTVKPINLKPARPSALVGRPGEFRSSYDWREVLPGQTLPRGLEILSSVDENDKRPTIARIPPRWKLEVAIKTGVESSDTNAQAPLRMEVEARTTIGEIQEALRRHLQCLERVATTAGEGCPALFVDGERVVDPSVNVAHAQLFGKKVVCCAS